jgi:hypothetical protein
MITQGISQRGLLKYMGITAFTTSHLHTEVTIKGGGRGSWPVKKKSQKLKYKLKN